jgi:hypothetical protein
MHFHFFVPQEKTNSVLWAAFAGLIIFVSLLGVLPSEEWFMKRLGLNQTSMNRVIYPALGILCYAFLILGYFVFYFTADRSITFRMLMIADQQPGQVITAEQMLEKYDTPTIILRRLDDLSYGGYLVRNEKGYQLTTKGQIAVAIYRFTIEFLRLGRF